MTMESDVGRRRTTRLLLGRTNSADGAFVAAMFSRLELFARHTARGPHAQRARNSATQPGSAAIASAVCNARNLFVARQLPPPHPAARSGVIEIARRFDPLGL